MRVLKSGCVMMALPTQHHPGPRGGAVAGEIDKETPSWSEGVMSETIAALTSGSKLSVTSYLPILADDEPEVAV